MKNDRREIMREVLLEELSSAMEKNRRIFFLTDDLGARKLDGIRGKHADRFINVGIAEQNLINVATGLSLEGFEVYAYGISTFLVMRAYEQIRNLAILAQLKKVCVNLIGVGAGLSYDVSGPTHHCIEDITLMRLLPNFTVYSPSDGGLARDYVALSLKTKQPTYIRLEGKPVPVIHRENTDYSRGFEILRTGKDICLVATGIMVHKALKVADDLRLRSLDAAVIDLYRLKPLPTRALIDALTKSRRIVTVEEHLLAGGLGSAIGEILLDKGLTMPLRRFGIDDTYLFTLGGRERAHRLLGIDENIAQRIAQWAQI